MNQNSSIKMRVLKNLRAHMDNKLKDRLRPKQNLPELAKELPKPMGEELADEDKQRLLDLYGKLQ